MKARSLIVISLIILISVCIMSVWQIIPPFGSLSDSNYEEWQSYIKLNDITSISISAVHRKESNSAAVKGSSGFSELAKLLSGIAWEPANNNIINFNKDGYSYVFNLYNSDSDQKAIIKLEHKEFGYGFISVSINSKQSRYKIASSDYDLLAEFADKYTLNSIEKKKYLEYLNSKGINTYNESQPLDISCISASYLLDSDDIKVIHFHIPGQAVPFTSYRMFIKGYEFKIDNYEAPDGLNLHIFKDNSLYTLSEAFYLNVISYDELKYVYELWGNGADYTAETLLMPIRMK